MLEGKILGIFTSLDYESFTIKELSTLSNSKKDDVKLVVSILLKRKKITEVKNKYKLSE